jgi:hypothetical protein
MANNNQSADTVFTAYLELSTEQKMRLDAMIGAYTMMRAAEKRTAPSRKRSEDGETAAAAA